MKISGRLALVIALFTAGCTSSAGEMLPAGEVAPPDGATSVVTEYDHEMGYSIGDDLLGSHASTGVTNVGRTLETSAPQTVAGVIVTAHWNATTPASRSFYMFLKEAGEGGSKVGEGVKGESPLVLALEGPFAADTHEIWIYPAPGNAATGERVKLIATVTYGS